MCPLRYTVLLWSISIRKSDFILFKVGKLHRFDGMFEHLTEKTVAILHLAGAVEVFQLCGSGWPKPYLVDAVRSTFGPHSSFRIRFSHE
ncbi:hypothetical protein EV356DRAFT_317278 [Viridothelium virens]|uniref:Uncharacterized protein n=1 Tax=Viridothelium virens TaxID=1048519 RepID=A0A6A6GZ28_VIRVR|nr:hypothetical protein EV356DRAFT_317278 [Viridothelium virens]